MGGHYAVATLADRVVIVDLARVREGEMYAQFLTQLMGASAPSQRLLFAERLTLSHEEYDLFEENAVEFATLGFDVEMVEGTTIDVVGIPADVKAEMVDRAIYDLLQSLQSPEEATSRAEVMARRLAHSDSVRRTQFGEEEALRIVNGVLESGRTISPLGKPFMVEISAKDVKNRLG
jgi:DNA mismatch repair protein MutL